MRRTSFGGIGHLDGLWRELFGQAVDGTELVQRIGFGGCVAFRGQRTLACVDDEPGHIQPTLNHFGQVHLGIQIGRVIVGLGEIDRVDIGMGIERDDAFVDATRALDKRLFGFGGRRRNSGRFNNGSSRRRCLLRRTAGGDGQNGKE
jgi:hypothetical protein